MFEFGDLIRQQPGLGLEAFHCVGPNKLKIGSTILN